MDRHHEDGVDDLRLHRGGTGRGLAHWHFGAFSLDFEVVYYVLEADYGVFMDVQQGINLQLLRGFSGQHIEFAFPTQTLHMNHSAIPSLSSMATAPDPAAAA